MDLSDKVVGFLSATRGNQELRRVDVVPPLLNLDVKILVLSSLK